MKTLRGGIAAAALLALLAAASPALGAPRYASPGGAGPAGTCPRSNPCNIQDAIEHASVAAGDVVNLLPGTYNTGADDIEVEDAITVQGLPGAARPTVVGDYTSTAVLASTFEMFADGSVLRDVNVERVDDAFNYTIFTQANVTIERTTIVARGGGGVGILLKSSDGGTSVLRDSVVWSRTPDSAILIGGIGGGSGLSHLRVVGVTAYADSGWGIVASASYGASETTIRNTIARAPASSEDLFLDGNALPNTVTVTTGNSNYADHLQNGLGTSFTEDTATNQSAPPQFVNAGAGDFHQVVGSPTVDAGATVTSMGTLDLDRQPRSMRLGVDIGADELPDACRGRLATVIGTSGADVLAGTAAADVVFAGAGNDRVKGLGGKDLVCSGAGNDSVIGGAGKDTLRGEAGRDTLRGKAGRDKLIGGGGRDKLFGGAGRDNLRGGPGRDLQIQ